MRRHWKKILRGMIALAVTVGCAIYIFRNRDELSVLLEISGLDICMLAASMFGFFVVSGYTFKLLVSMLSIRLSVKEWLGLTVLTNALNYLGPVRPGALAKAAYLKKEKGMPYSHFSSILAATGFIQMFYSGLAGSLILLAVWYQKNIFSLPLFMVCAFFMCVSIIPFLIRIVKIKREGRFWNMFNLAITGFAQIRSERRKMFMVVASLFAQYTLSAICVTIAYNSLGLEIDLVTATMLGIFASMANFFTITPNNIGVQELIIGYLYTVVGWDLNDGIIGATLLRSVHIFIAFTITPFFAFILLRKKAISPSLLFFRKKD